LNDTPPDFTPILTLIRDAQGRALQRVNRELIDLYWQIGAYLHARIEADGWGRGTVRQLADWLAQEHPQARGFSASNLWRMGQFYDTYRATQTRNTVARTGLVPPHDHHRPRAERTGTRILPSGRHAPAAPHRPAPVPRQLPAGLPEPPARPQTCGAAWSRT